MKPKVSLEVTASGWKWTVEFGDDVYGTVTHEMRADKGGGFKGVGKGDIFDKLPDHQDLAEAIDDRDLMGIADALSDLL